MECHTNSSSVYERGHYEAINLVLLNTTVITFAFSTNQIKNKKGNSQTTFNFIKNKANNYPFSFRIYDRFYKCKCAREPNYIISGELKLVNGDIKKHLAITTQNKITEDLLLTLIQKEIEEEENNA